ncbi:MAG TPA: 1-acyl-sn-glycerol-3-phosphate acyltransferase, partial [Pseudonocardiaceae bacterium]
MANARVIPLHGKTGTPANGTASDALAVTRRTARRGRTEPTAVPPPPEEPTEATEKTEARPKELADRLADFVAFTRRRITGEYEVDEFGFDAELTDNMLLPPLRQLFQKWFRIEVIGAHNLPDDTGALLVANHSGTFPLDATMTAIAVRDHHPKGRFLRMLGADLVFRTPV